MKVYKPNTDGNLGIVYTLSKLSRTCVLRICADRLYFIVPEEHRIPYRISVWTILKRNEFFQNYIMVGETEKNEILLEFSSDMLASSLSSVKAGNNVISMKIKLTDKVAPCITLELELASQGSLPQMCIHDVPVTVIPPKEWDEYQEPAAIDYNVSIQMPSTKIAKNIVDKLKKIGNKVTITATTAGKFSLRAKTTSATIEIHFKDLTVKKSKNAAPSASVCVDIKKMSQFLTCDAIYPNVMICNILDNRMVHLSLTHTGFELNYYLMAVDD